MSYPKSSALSNHILYSTPKDISAPVAASLPNKDDEIPHLIENQRQLRHQQQRCDSGQEVHVGRKIEIQRCEHGAEGAKWNEHHRIECGHQCQLCQVCFGSVFLGV